MVEPGREDQQTLYDETSRLLPVGRVGEVTDIAEAYVYLMNQGYAIGHDPHGRRRPRPRLTRQTEDMARILVTGSADGLGHLAASELIDQGHDVVLHARSQARAADATAALPKASGVLIGDLASIAETRELARQANESGGSTW